MRQMLRGYVALGTGLAEMGRQRLVELGRSLAERDDIDLDRVAAATEPVLRQVQDTVAWMVARSQASRELFAEMVREEVERAAVGLGLVRVEDLDDLEDRVEELERSVAALRLGSAKPAAATTAAPTKSPARQSPVKKSQVKKSQAKKSQVKKSQANNASPAGTPQTSGGATVRGSRSEDPS